MREDLLEGRTHRRGGDRAICAGECGKRTFKLKGGMGASEFPALKEMIVEEGAPFALDTDLLRQAIKELQWGSLYYSRRCSTASVCTSGRRP